MEQKPNMIILACGDNVGIALRDIVAGTIAHDKQGTRISVDETIPQGHKIALTAIAEGQPVIRFSMPVGKTTKPIAAGRLVHIHNVESQYLNNEHDHYE
jgi:hypothetical protein